MQDESDEHLVALALAANPLAREALVRRYLRAAFVVAVSIVGNAADAEDIAQDSMIIALNRLHQCREPAHFSAWLRHSVRNHALKHLRRVKVRQAFALRPQVEPEVDDTSNVPVRKHLLKALEGLSPVQREVVLLHDLESWTHAEIADTLAISEVSSRQHLFVARKHLRQSLAWETAPKAKEGSHG